MTDDERETIWLATYRVRCLMGKNGDIGPAQEPFGESVFTFSALNLNKSVNDRDQTGIRITFMFSLDRTSSADLDLLDKM